MNKKNNTAHVILMGDSVLDNFYWLENPYEDIEKQLKDLCLEKYKKFITVTNLALDETESKDILNGKIPSKVYVEARKKFKKKNYVVEEDGYFRPLRILKDYKPTHVVLSIGGNDARTCLQYGKSEQIFSALLNNGFKENYLNAVENVYKICQRLILVVVYRPGPDFYTLISQNEINNLYKKTIPFILSVARKYNLPVIDLSRTFDVNDDSHYGSTPIEPSNKSGKFISELILYVIKNFKFNSDQSKIFYGINDIIFEFNTEDYNYEL